MALGRIVRDILRRHNINPYRIARQQEEDRVPTGGWSGLYKLMNGDLRYSEYPTLYRHLSAVPELSTSDAVIATTANFLAIVETEVQEFAVYLLYSLLSPRERIVHLAHAVEASGLSLDAIRTRLPLARREGVADVGLEAFAAVARRKISPLPGMPDRRAEWREAREISDALALTRQVLARTLVASIQWDSRHGSFLVEWTADAREMLDRAEIADVEDSTIGYRLDRRGVAIRSGSAAMPVHS